MASNGVDSGSGPSMVEVGRGRWSDMSGRLIYRSDGQCVSVGNSRLQRERGSVDQGRGDCSQTTRWRQRGTIDAKEVNVEIEGGFEVACDGYGIDWPGRDGQPDPQVEATSCFFGGQISHTDATPGKTRWGGSNFGCGGEPGANRQLSRIGQSQAGSCACLPTQPVVR